MISTKAASATELHIAHVGRAALTVRSMVSDLQRIPLEQLAGRYQMWAHRCMNLNAQVAASVPFKLVRVVRSNTLRRDLISCRSLPYRAPSVRELAFIRGRMDTQPSPSVRKLVQGATDDLVVIDRHPLLDLLHEINPWTDGYAFREARCVDLQMFGRAYALIVGDDEPRELWRMMPQKTRPLKHPVDFVSGFAVGHGQDEQVYTPEEVLWYRLHDPSDPWGGRGPLEAWLATVDSSLEVQGYQRDVMHNHGTPDGIIVSEAPVGEDQKRAFRADWKRMFQFVGGMFGRRRESVAFLANAKYERIAQTHTEMQFTESMQILRDFVGQAFGVPKPLLTADDVNRTNAREARQQHMELTIWPLVQRIEDVDNAQLVKRYGDDLALMHENPIPEDETIRIQERQSLLASGYSVNEVRVEEGKEPLDDPDADVPLLAAGLTPLGMAQMSMDQARRDMEQGDEQVDTDVDPLVAGLDVAPQQVLQGAQITAATAIIQAVVDDQLPLESARGQLIVMFNLTPEQADQMLAGVDTFEKPEPEPVPMAPGAPPLPSGGGPAPAREDSERSLGAPPWETMLVLAKALAPESTPPVPAHYEITIPVHITQAAATPQSIEVCCPPVHVQAPPQLPAPNVDVHVEAAKAPDVHLHPEFEINIPEQKAPIVKVDAPHIDVHVPEQKAPIVEVNTPAPIVNVEPPSVEVHPPNVMVKAPDVKIEMAPEIKAPVVHVAAPDVRVEPHINVTPIVDLPPRRVTFKRDRDTGAIKEAEVMDGSGS